MTLRTKTSFLLAVITFLTLGVTGFFYLQFLQQSLKNSILSGVEAVAQTTSESIARFLADSLSDAQAAALALPVAALENNDMPVLEKRLRELVENYPKFENGMFILDKNGRIWVDYPSFPQVRGVDVSFREYFKRTIQEQKGVISVPYISKRTGQPVITFTALLRGSANQVLGVLGCSVQILSPRALGGIRETRIGKSGYVYVYDKSRLMILHPDDARVLKRDVPPGVNRLFDAALQGFEGIGETVNSRGIHMLLAVKSIPGTDWIIGAQQFQSEAYAPIAQARRNLLGWIFLTVIASLGVGTLAVRRITRPLARLRQGVLLLGAAEPEDSEEINLELKNIGSRDEIGELARAFLDISHKLRDTMTSLRRASNDWERTFNTVPDLIAIIDDENRVVKINQPLAEKIGVSIQEAVNLKCSQLFQDLADMKPTGNPPPDPEEGCTPILELLQKKLGPDFLVTASPLKSSEGEPLGSVYVARDISERKQAEAELLKYKDHLEQLVAERTAALADSEARFRAVFKEAPLGIGLYDRKGRLFALNPALERTLGYSLEEYNQWGRFVVHPEDAHRVLRLYGELAAGRRQSYVVEARAYHLEGRVIWGRCHMTRVKGLDDNSWYGLGLIEDITQEKQAQAEISAYQERLRALATELTLTEERERRRLASDLHDNIGQVLALLQIKLGSLRQNLPSPEMAADLDAARHLLSQIISATRTLTLEMGLSVLHELGFEAGVEWLGEKFQEQFGLRMEVSCEPLPATLSSVQKTFLFRAIRELLVNVAKHAKASQVRISVKTAGDHLSLQVVDDGKGFVVSNHTALDGFGLFSINERISNQGGKMEVLSAPGQGTRIIITLPLFEDLPGSL